MRLGHSLLAIVATVAIQAVGPVALVAQGPPPPPGYHEDRDDRQWEAPPPEFQDIQRRGFHDGIEGARKDFDNHRQPNVNNRDEYRHPEVPGWARHDYRQAFRRGYQVGAQHIYGGPHRE